MTWLTQKQDQYSAAWRVWTFRGDTEGDAAIVTPTQVSQRHHFNGAVDMVRYCGKSLGNGWRHYRSNFAEPLLGSNRHWEELLAGISSWWEDGEFVISYHNTFPRHPLGVDDKPDVIQRF